MESFATDTSLVVTVLAYGGMPCVVETIQEQTGIVIPFAGIVQFMGAAAISEAVGGVSVCVAEPIEDEHTDLYLEAGTHELKGLQALQFLRTRYGVGDGSGVGGGGCSLRVPNTGRPSSRLFICRSTSSMYL